MQSDGAMLFHLKLAVPSDGSNPMQHDCRGVVIGQGRSCSTLRRVEPYATPIWLRWHLRASTLQYPQTGRTLCNSRHWLCSDALLTLSVPSYGSNPMQL